MTRIRAAVLTIVMGASALSALGASAQECAPPDPPALRFHTPVFIDQHRGGGEPVSVVADDGAILVAAHTGDTHLYLRTLPEAEWAAQYRNQSFVWRSTDTGKTWQRIEWLAPGTAMHSPATAIGPADPDFAKDSAGNLYETELEWNVPVAVSRDNGVTWPEVNPIADVGDRPWIVARGPNEVYLRVTGSFQKSTDAGATWESRTDPPAYGDLWVDPTDPQGLFAPLRNGVGVAVSRDDGQSWQSHSIPGASNRAALQSIAVDAEGWAYAGYAHSDNKMYFSSWNPATEAWAAPLEIPKVAGGTPMWPWVDAGDAGRAAVGWYQYTPVPGQSGTYEMRVYVAVTTNARGSTHECEDGTVVEVPPRFSVADAADRPIHVGQIPCSGTGCNATGDRRLGDFFTINHDSDGRVFVATGDTTLTNIGDFQYQVSRPLFMIAEADSPRLTAP